MGWLSDIDEFLFGYGPTLSGGIVGDALGGIKDCVVENPGKALLAVGATVATGGFAAPVIAATAGKTLVAEAVTATVITLASRAASDAYDHATKKEDDKD